MKTNVVRGWAAAAFVAAGVIGALGSGSAEANGGRRFKGTADGAITGATSPVDLIVDYTGTATHLGTFTRRELVHINADGTIVGTIVFVAANGDELDVSLSGQFTSLAGDAVAGGYTFTGGTGRFSDATGSATFAGTIVNGQVSVSFDGTIDY
jgi:hypothetical protein